MKIGLTFRDRGVSVAQHRDLLRTADGWGLDSIWVGESYGTDAVSPLAYVAAITENIGIGTAVLQMPGRTPANVGMTAITLDHLSSGRLRLGLGMSGPQVVEGWHGVPYGKPLAKTREYVDVVRRVVARDEPVTYDGDHYQVPYQGMDATGLGKPLKSMVRPLRDRVPIYLAAIGPRNLELTGEIADGWLPIFYSPEKEAVLCESLDKGLQKSGRALDDIDIVANPPVAIGDDIDACRDRIRPSLALYIGGMGARDKNFYFDLACRYGYEDEAERIQSLYLDGNRADSAAAVPDELVDEVALVGPLERVIERLSTWRDSRVSTLCLDTYDPRTLEQLLEAI